MREANRALSAEVDRLLGETRRQEEELRLLRAEVQRITDGRRWPVSTRMQPAQYEAAPLGERIRRCLAARGPVAMATIADHVGCADAAARSRLGLEVCRMVGSGSLRRWRSPDDGRVWIYDFQRA